MFFEAANSPEVPAYQLPLLAPLKIIEQMTGTMKLNSILGVKLEIICELNRRWRGRYIARQRTMDRQCMAVSEPGLMLHIFMPSLSNVRQDVQGTDSHQCENARNNQVAF